MYRDTDVMRLVLVKEMDAGIIWGQSGQKSNELEMLVIALGRSLRRFVY